MRLSVSLICSNNEWTIEKVLKSIEDIADEIIIIIDTNSKDRTEEICRKYTKLVSVEPWRGFLNQKNEALSRCQGEWVLDLDSDEVVTPELKKEILKAIEVKDLNGALLNRRTFYVGEYLNYAWKPDWRLRLVRRSANPKWGGDPIHSLMTVDGKTKNLKGNLDHFSYADVDDHMQRTLKYAKGVAKNKFESGKRFSFIKAVFAPMISFINQYFFKRAFLDGFRGLVAAVSAGLYSFLKNVYLWEMEQNKKNKKEE